MANIQLDGSNVLNITGNLSLGDTAANVFIGDGTSVVDVIFEQNGAIRALSSKTLTLGQSDSLISFAANISGNLNIAGQYRVAGNQAVNGPAFRAYVDTAQTITSGTQQKVTFGTENFDTNSNFATSRFTPTVAGYYQFNAVVRFDGTSGTGECMIVLYKNGAEYARGTNISGTEQGANFWSMEISEIANANGSTDFFEVYVQQTSGASRTTTAGPAISHFSGCMIRGV